MTTHLEAKLYLSLLYINIKELESLYSFKNLKMVCAPLNEHECAGSVESLLLNAHSGFVVLPAHQSCVVLERGHVVGVRL